VFDVKNVKKGGMFTRGILAGISANGCPFFHPNFENYDISPTSSSSFFN
jgi:hypothetical protein